MIRFSPSSVPHYVWNLYGDVIHGLNFCHRCLLIIWSNFVNLSILKTLRGKLFTQLTNRQWLRERALIIQNKSHLDSLHWLILEIPSLQFPQICVYLFVFIHPYQCCWDCLFDEMLNKSKQSLLAYTKNIKTAILYVPLLPELVGIVRHSCCHCARKLVAFSTATHQLVWYVGILLCTSALQWTSDLVRNQAGKRIARCYDMQ